MLKRNICLFDIPAPVLPSLDHNKYRNAPGQFWGADDQCRLLLKDQQASLYDASSLDVINFNLIP
jgi:hypothetical protein